MPSVLDGVCALWEVAVLEIAQLLVDWFYANARDLPWRADYDPYHVFVSEIMLQQTQMETVIPYFLRWINVYPDLSSLAKAQEEEALKLWEGLGYYSRCRNLLACARRMVADGFLSPPGDVETLLLYPGIGPYTAGAVSSIAYNKPTPAVDGNVERVTARLFDLDEPLGGGVLKKKVTALVRQLIPLEGARSFNQGMMELGALVCLPGTPRCVDCPLVSHCESFKKGITALRPVPKVRPPIENVEAVGMLLLVDGGILLRQRPKKGLWSGFWEVPWVSAGTGDPIPLAAAWIQEELKCKAQIEIETQRVAFSFTRYRVKAWTLRCALDDNPLAGGIDTPQWQLFQLEEVMALTLSSGSRRFLKGILSGLGSRARSNPIVS